MRSNPLNNSKNIQNSFYDNDNIDRLKQIVSLTNAIIKQIDEISNDSILQLK